MIFRRGDVVRFRRGSNEYVGTITSIYGGPLAVVTESGVLMHVAARDVKQVVVPVLTAKERVGLLALSDHEKLYKGSSVTVTVRDLALVRGDSVVTGSCLAKLQRRGLVYQARYGITGLVSLWGLTDEGRRVAAL